MCKAAKLQAFLRLVVFVVWNSRFFLNLLAEPGMSAYPRFRANFEMQAQIPSRHVTRPSRSTPSKPFAKTSPARSGTGRPAATPTLYDSQPDRTLFRERLLGVRQLQQRAASLVVRMSSCGGPTSDTGGIASGERQCASRGYNGGDGEMHTPSPP